MTPDLINGLFEFVGAGMTWMTAWRVYRDRGYAGVWFPAVAFFTCWGGWNMYYYPHLGQFWSMAGGAALVSANLCWIGLMLFYGRKR